MRNLPKFVGFIAIIVIICFFFSTCDETNGLNSEGNGDKTPTAGLLFTLIDGPAYSVSIGEADAVHIVIPAKYNDLPVTTIKQDGFKDSAILSVTIPHGITKIDASAFSGCKGLTSVTIPDSVISIDYEAFRGCTGLTNVTIGNSVTSIGNFAFLGWTSSQTIHIPFATLKEADAAWGSGLRYGCNAIIKNNAGIQVAP